MSIVKCKNNHYYDRGIYPRCPHCGETALAGETGENELRMEQFEKQKKTYTSISKVDEFSVKKKERVEVKIESDKHNSLDFVYQTPPTERYVNRQIIDTETEYDLEHGFRFRIDDIFANGCIYETHVETCSSREGGRKIHSVAFAEWNQTVQIGMVVLPGDVTWELYLTFSIPEQIRRTLPEAEVELPRKASSQKDDNKWVCPKCGAVNCGSFIFCTNCGRSKYATEVYKGTK